MRHNDYVLTRTYEHYTTKEQVKIKDGYAYFFYFNKQFRKSDEPIIIVERPVIVKNGIYYNKLFVNQWEYYIPVNDPKITVYDVVYHEGTNDDNYVILNQKVYKSERIEPEKLKKMIKGYEQLSLFDF